MKYEKLHEIIGDIQSERDTKKIREAKDASQMKALKKRPFELHKQAILLATQLEDYYDVQPELDGEPEYHKYGPLGPYFRGAYSRTTPAIPIGEIPVTEKRDTAKAIARVSVSLGAEILTKRHNFAPLLGRRSLEIVDIHPDPRNYIHRVAVSIYSAGQNEDSLLPLAMFDTWSSYSCPIDETKASIALAKIIKGRERVVDALQSLAEGLPSES